MGEHPPAKKKKRNDHLWLVDRFWQARFEIFLLGLSWQLSIQQDMDHFFLLCWWENVMLCFLSKNKASTFDQLPCPPAGFVCIARSCQVNALVYIDYGQKKKIRLRPLHICALESYLWLFMGFSCKWPHFGMPAAFSTRFFTRSMHKNVFVEKENDPQNCYVGLPKGPLLQEIYG